MNQKRFLLILAVCAMLIAMMAPVAQAGYFFDPTWTPIYQGVEYFAGSSVYAVKVDLWNPNVSLYASHDNGASAKEVLTETGALFNSNHGCQVSVNASYCDPTSTGQAATNVDVWGLAICDGVVVSPGYYGGGAQYNCQMRFTADKVASIVQTMDTPVGIHTAVTGNAYHLVDGYPLGATSGTTQRTSFGLSADGRYLFMAICTSSTIYNMSLRMLDLGAWNAINMDGGGSSCMTRADIGKVYPSGTERRVGIHLGVRTQPLINPPWMFDSTIQAFTPQSSASAIDWAGSDWGWPGVMFFDQTGNDCFVYSPSCNFTGAYYPQVVSVRLYEQYGNSSSHNMQAFWKTNWDNAFDAYKSSPVVNFTAQNSWKSVNLDVNSEYWYSAPVNQIRLDFDNINVGARHIVDRVVVQNQLWWTFDSDIQGFSAGNAVTTPWWWTETGFPGMLVVDQIGGDAWIYTPLIGGAGLPYNYLGGSNDTIHVRLWVTGGNTTNHDMQVFWIQANDQNWDGAKSSAVVNYSGNDQWKDVYIPVGQNAIWGDGAQVQLIRLDLDNGNNAGARYHIDFVRTEY